MGKTIKLAGRVEAGEILGVSRQRIAKIENRPGFPKPLDVVNRQPIWRRADLERYKAKLDEQAAAAVGGAG